MAGWATDIGVGIGVNDPEAGVGVVVGEVRGCASEAGMAGVAGVAGIAGTTEVVEREY